MKSSEEFREVADSFNRMAERLTEYRASTLADILSAKKFLEAIVNSINEPIIGLNTEREILFHQQRGTECAQFEKRKRDPPICRRAFF